MIQDLKMQSKIFGSIRLIIMTIRIVGFLKMSDLVYKMVKMKYI